MRLIQNLILCTLIAVLCNSCAEDDNISLHYKRYTVRNGTNEDLVITGTLAESTVFTDTLLPLDERILMTVTSGGLSDDFCSGDLQVLDCDTIRAYSGDSLLYSWSGYSVSPIGMYDQYEKVGNAGDTTLYLWEIKQVINQ